MGEMVVKTGPKISLYCFAILALTAHPLVSAYEKEPAAELVAIIQAVERGWEQADGTPFRDHFLDFKGARYFESGGENQGLQDLVEHHVEPEGNAFEDFDLQFSNIETHIEGNFAWATADTELKALLKRDGRKIHNRGHETFLFRLINGNWKVVHTHSSSRPVKTTRETETD